MPRNHEFQGRDLEEALAAASDRLGIPQEKIHYQLLDEGRRGVFGLGAREVRILVEAPAFALGADEPAEVETPEVSPPPSPLPDRSGEVEDEEPGQADAGPSDPDMENLAGTVDRMMDLMRIRLEASVIPVKGGARLELRGRDRKMLLQKDAEFLNSLQFLLNRMSRRAWPGVRRIQVVCEGHRNRRDGELVKEVREIADQVARSGRSKRLQPMNPYERRLVHLTIREYPGLETRSEGDGFMKTIKVCRARGD
jgi:spoIIIJ-associated protein